MESPGRRRKRLGGEHLEVPSRRHTWRERLPTCALFNACNIPRKEARAGDAERLRMQAAEGTDLDHSLGEEDAGR